jgi:intein/homing endonuclease
VLTEQGEVPIRQIVEQEMVGTKLPSYNESTGQVEMDEVMAVASNGTRDIIELQLEDGETLKLTEDHLVMTQRGWVQAGELTTEDELLSLKEHKT